MSFTRLQTDYSDSTPTPTLHPAAHNDASTVVNEHSDLLETVGRPSGIATLGSDGKVPLAELPDVVTYTNATPTPSSLGGIPAGATFNGVTVDGLFDELLYPLSFSAFSISGQPTIVEVGATISGSKTFVWTCTDDSGVVAGSVEIIDNDGVTILASGLAPTGSIAIDVGTITRTTPGTYTWTLRGTKNAGGTFVRTFVITWDWKIYAGTLTNVTLTESQIEALVVAQLGSLGLGNYTLAAGGYKYICYPVTLAAADLFTDLQTGFNVPMADSGDNAAYDQTANGNSYALVSVTNVFSQTVNYRIYRTKNVLGAAITIKVS